MIKVSITTDVWGDDKIGTSCSVVGIRPELGDIDDDGNVPLLYALRLPSGEIINDVYADEFVVSN